MFYIFIFESIGTSELMLIGLVALIIFGPRRLPELARTFGKTMAEFRRSSDDFKKTWKQELDLEEAKKSLEMLTDFRDEDAVKNDISVSRNSRKEENNIVEPKMPEINEISKSRFNDNFTGEKINNANEPQLVKTAAVNKQDWL